MTTKKQIIAIAELDGWTVHYREEGLTPHFCRGGVYYSLNNFNYLTSRDAIVPVIEKQPMHVQIDFIKHLHAMVGSSHSEIVKDLFCFMTKVELIAEALLRATGKWSEE